MSEAIVGVVVFIITVIASFVYFEMFKIPSIRKTHERIGELAEGNQKSEYIKAAIDDFKQSAEMKAIQELSYQKGLQEGQENTMKKFEVKITPYIKKRDGIFSALIENGYSMQLCYNGIMIGDPTIRITQSEYKVKKDDIEKYVKIGIDVAKGIANAYRNSGMLTSVGDLETKRN